MTVCDRHPHVSPQFRILWDFDADPLVLAVRQGCRSDIDVQIIEHQIRILGAHDENKMMLAVRDDHFGQQQCDEHGFYQRG